MDANKDKKLAEIGYAIHRTCGQCAHFQPGRGSFGTCKLFTYQHLKHTDEERQLSVNVNGSCQRFEWSVAARTLLGLFSKYIE